MIEGKYTIHKGKESQHNKDTSARESLKKSLADTAFRLDTIDTIDGVEFINDTLAMDLLSTRDSFKCLENPAVWLTTTTLHDRDFSIVENQVGKKIKAIVVYGVAAIDMKQKFSGLVDDFATTANLEEGVKKSFELASENEAVIYSPSCVTSDGYANFVERGKAFIKNVKNLKNG